MREAPADSDIPALINPLISFRHMELTKYTDVSLISFFKAKNRDDVLHHLVDLAQKAGKISDAAHFFEKVKAREAITSTGIGLSTAIPHAKEESLKDFFIAIGVLEEGIDWRSLDDRPARLIFLVGGPESKQTEYLQILSSLTILIKDEGIRKKMLTVNSPQAMMSLLKKP